MTKTIIQPKNIIFYCWDAIGHINPYISIALELKARGHRVCFVTLRKLDFEDRFHNTGLEFHYCVESQPELDASNANVSNIGALQKIFRLGPRKAFKMVYNVNAGLGQRMDDIIENHNLIEAKLQSLKPDLILVDTVHGIPCLTSVAPRWVRLFSAFPSILYSNFNDNIVAGMGLTRDEVAKPEMKQLEIEIKAGIVAKVKQFFLEKGAQAWPGKIDLSPTSSYLNFCFGPDELCLEYQTDIKQLDKTWVRLEHTLNEPDVVGRFKIPERLIDLPGKLIYFSLGTLVTSDTEMINRLLGLLSKSPNKFIISMGHKHKEIFLYSNMWGDKYVDQKAILPNVDLFITHGGHNSIIEAFYYGVPGLIVLPVFADQFDIAQRVQDCGFGKRLDPYNCSQEELLDSIETLLLNRKLIEAMRSSSIRLKSIEYHKIAANHIETILT